MITDLLLRRFKRFVHLRLPLHNLTVLTGANGTGKTTVIQAMLLARQASEVSAGFGVVKLNGPYGLELGEGIDVLFREAEQPKIELELTDSSSYVHRWCFSVSEERCLYLSVDERPEDPPSVFTGTDRQFTYLGANRLGPRDTLPAAYEDLSHLGVGVRGENIAHVLTTHGRDEVAGPRRFQDSEVVTLLHQTERWISKIVGPIEIMAEWFPKSTVTRLLFKTPGIRSEWMRPANVGFGISYSLPIIVAGLLAPEDGLLIVENPEAHLHPAGQSAIGTFLARVASDGVQVIVETHSDHVLNGIRMAAAIQPPILRHDNIIVHFFHQEGSVGPETTPIRISAVGKLSAWPRGFFDQFERDLGALAKPNSRRSG